MASFSHTDETFNIGIFLYEGVEELDFCGPFEVMKSAALMRSQREQKPDWQVFTVAEETPLLKTSGNRYEPASGRAFGGTRIGGGGCSLHGISLE